MLASRYEVIYYVNINSNKYTMYSSSDVYSQLGTTKSGRDFFADSAEDARKYIFKEDLDYVLSELKKENLNIESQSEWDCYINIQTAAGPRD